jgi:acetyl/propionyl-CoA carboxylase alpha subunit
MSGRSLVIIGGTSGIGLELARHALEQGDSVVVTGRDAARAAQPRWARTPLTHRLEAVRTGPGRFEITAGGEMSIVDVLYYGDGRIRVLIDEDPLEAGIVLGPEEVLISLRGETHTLRKPPPPAVDETGPGADAAASLTAPMPGTVVKVLVEEGQEDRFLAFGKVVVERAFAELRMLGHLFNRGLVIALLGEYGERRGEHGPAPAQALLLATG